MKVLVTGATGFVGGNLIPVLVEKGYEVRCLVRDEVKAKEKFGKLSEKLEFWKGDLTKLETLSGITKGVDYVVHLAAHGHVAAASEAAYKKFMGINVGGTENLLRECLKNKVKKVIHFSSTAAVGLIPDIVVDEGTKPNPKSPYQKSKLESERVVLEYFKRGVPVVIFRPCMIYGIGGLGEFHKFVKLIKSGVMPKIGFGEKMTPIVNVEDVVQSVIKGLDKARLGETYFVCGMESYQFDTLCKCIADSLKVEWPRIVMPEFMGIWGAWGLEKLFVLLGKTPPVTPKNIKSTIANRYFSIQKARKDFGYDPNAELELGIEEVIDWYNRQSLI